MSPPAVLAPAAPAEGTTGAATGVKAAAPVVSARALQASDGDTIDGRWALRQDDLNWANDLAITYRRRR